MYSAGGTSANVAANLAVLGWSALLHARIGMDPAGVLVQEDLQRDGVELATSYIEPGLSTPVVIVEPSMSRPRYRFRCPGCGAPYARHRPIRDMDIASSQDADVIFLDRTSAAGAHLAETASDRGQVVFFEPNSLGSIKLFRRVLAVADVVKFSNERASDFRHLLDEGRQDQIQICTLGKEGFAVRRAFGDWKQYSAPSAAAVDTVGAGDMFTAALLDLLMIDARRDVELSQRVMDATQGAQWFAAAQTQREGARGLTRGRSRAEVMAEVEAVRSGQWRGLSPQIAAGRVPLDGCESWLCQRWDDTERMAQVPVAFDVDKAGTAS